MNTQILSSKAVCERTSFSRATLGRLVKAGRFPQPVRITDRRVGFYESEVDEWMQQRARKAA